MSAPIHLKIDPDKVHEIPMVDLAFMILKSANTPFYYRDLMVEVAKVRKMSEEEMNNSIAQLYTEINIDGRFACVGVNLWGLKRWYPVERSEDPIANAKRPRIINDDDDDLDDDDFVEEEETYAADDDEDYDVIDEDKDELFPDEEDDAEVEDESLLEDDDLDDEDADDSESSEDENEEEDL